MGDGDIWILHDLTIPNAERLFIEAGGVSNQNGKAPEGLFVEIYNKDMDNTELKINSTHKRYTKPKKLKLGGYRVMIRLRNRTGNTQDTTGYVSFKIIK
jgi:hypothetical protein